MIHVARAIDQQLESILALDTVLLGNTNQKNLLLSAMSL